MASAITNVEIIESSKYSTEDRKEAIKILKALVPQLNAIGLNKHCMWRNPKIQAIFDKNNDDWEYSPMDSRNLQIG